MEIKVLVPKDSALNSFKIFVIGKDGDKYSEYTEEEIFEFDPNETVIDLKDRAILEQEYNKIQKRLFDSELLLSKITTLLEILKKEEDIYNANRYQKIGQVKDEFGKPRVFKTETAISSYLLSSGLDDPIIQSLWGYIGRAKKDYTQMDLVVKALRGHMFKVKDIYTNTYSIKNKDSF